MIACLQIYPKLFIQTQKQYPTFIEKIGIIT